jgi:pimeloyl-ACP methyl ester carboxylesterase
VRHRRRPARLVPPARWDDRRPLRHRRLGRPRLVGELLRDRRRAGGVLGRAQRAVRRRLERAYLAKSAEFAARCGERNGRLLAHVSTTETARDLDHLRRLVGDDKLTYLGESYGTYIGQVYAAMFPHRIRAMALDGVVDGADAARGTRAVIASGLRDTDATYRQFLRLCDEAGARVQAEAFHPVRQGPIGPELCVLAGHGQSAADRADGLLARLRQHPLDGLTDGQALTALKLAAVGHPILWPEVARQFELAAEGDASAIVETAAFYNSEMVRRLLEPGQAILCADSPAGRDRRDWAKAVHRLERTSRIGARPMGWQIGAACASGPATAKARWTGPWRAPSAKVLVVNNRFDPNSPLASGRRGLPDHPGRPGEGDRVPGRPVALRPGVRLAVD